MPGDDDLSDLIARAQARPSHRAQDILKLSFIDWASVALAGLDEPVANLLRSYLEDEGGTPQAHFVGGGATNARSAALFNGTVSHALDYDDTHFAHIGHPSVAVFPAALAVAEQTGADVQSFLDASLVGVEASIRFGVVLGRKHYQTGFHQTATAGAFGATLAAAHLLGLDAERTRHALGLVSTRASGLKSQFGTMGKPLNAGIAASNGVEAAGLAARGFLSNPDGVFGPQGFFATHHGVDDRPAQPDGFLFETISHKFHACCHGLHAVLEAFATINSADPHEVTEIIIHTHPRWMSVCSIPTPATGLEAKFSYRAVVALALLGHDTARLDTFDDTLVTSPAVRGVLGEVQVVEDDTLAETASQVIVHRANGAPLRASADISRPLELEALRNRIIRKSAALVGATHAQGLHEAIQHTDAEISALTSVLTSKKPIEG